MLTNIISSQQHSRSTYPSVLPKLKYMSSTYIELLVYAQVGMAVRKAM